MRAFVLLVLLVCASSFPEVASGQRRSSRSSDAISSNPLAAIIDENNDGVLSRREIQMAANRIRELDTNKDGEITADELSGSDDSANQDEEVVEVEEERENAREERARPDRRSSQASSGPEFSDPYYADLNQELIDAIVQAGKFYKEKKYEEAGDYLEDALYVIEEVDDPKELMKMSQSLSRLAKAHQLISKRGVDLPELPDFKQLMAGRAPADTGRGSTNRRPATPAPRPEEVTSFDESEDEDEDAEPEGPRISFSKEVAPLLVQRCASCHIDKMEAGVSFVNYVDIVDGGSITDSDSSKSALIEMVASGKMPAKGKKLSKKEVQLLTDWVDQGTPFDGKDKFGDLK